MTNSSSVTEHQALPVFAGATLQLHEGGRFTSFRRPPLRGKGLPSGSQVNDGLSRGKKERRPAAKSMLASSHVHDHQQMQYPGLVDLGAEATQDFAARLAERDDVLQVTQPL